MAFAAIKILAVTVVLTAASAHPDRAKRGLMDDLMGQLHHGLDRFQESARRDLAALRPVAERVEKRVNSAMTDLHRQIFRPIFGGGSAADRDGEDYADYGDDYHSHIEQLFSQAMDPFRIFRRRKNWWEGENVCVDREVIDEAEAEDQETPTSQGGGLMRAFMHMDMTMTTCNEGETFRECTTKSNINGRKKTVIVRHRCCHGYTRLRAQLGCTGMEMVPLRQTVDELEGQEFLQLMETVGMDAMLEGDANYTIFVPTDDAIEDFRHDLERANSVQNVQYNVDEGLEYRRKRRNAAGGEITIVEMPRLEDILKGHMVEGFVDSSKVRDERVVEAVDGASNIRFNVYSTRPAPTSMANCARILSADHYATNGIVHTVDKVLVPATKTVGEVIETDAQFGKLAAVLRDTGLMERLKNPEEQVTLFAPVDAAFGRLTDDILTKIELGNGCSHDIVGYHILPNVICSGVITTKARTVNAKDKHVLLERDSDDVLYVDGVEVIRTDVMGTNGVIHVIDEVIMPESARNVEDALEESGLETLAELFAIAGITDDDLANATVFAPSERAFDDMPDVFMNELREDPNRLREFLAYHIARPKTCRCQFENNKRLPTLAAAEDKALRINSYDSFLLGTLPGDETNTVQCARILVQDDEVCGGMIHTIDKVLVPPAGKVIEIIKAHGEFSEFLKIIEFSELENELNTEGPYTVLAPTDAAMAIIRQETVDAILADKDLAIDFVRKHVVRDAVCCAGIPHQLPFMDTSGRRTLNGEVVKLHKSAGNHIYADRAEVVTCDLVANNGVVHEIDRAILPDALRGEATDRDAAQDTIIDIWKMFTK